MCRSLSVLLRACSSCRLGATEGYLYKYIPGTNKKLGDCYFEMRETLAARFAFLCPESTSY